MSKRIAFLIACFCGLCYLMSIVALCVVFMNHNETFSFLWVVGFGLVVPAIGLMMIILAVELRSIRRRKLAAEYR